MRKAIRHGTESRGFGSGIKALAWSPDSRFIASGDPDVSVWEVATGRTVCTFKMYTELRGIAWMPNQKRIVAASEFFFNLVDAASGKSLLNWDPHGRIQAIALSPKGQYIATVENDTHNEQWLVVVRDAISGNQISVFMGHARFVRTVAWSPDGRFIASGSNDTTVQIWDMEKEEAAFTYRGHSDWVNSVSWSPDGSRIASQGSGLLGSLGAEENTIHVWQAM